MAKKNKKIIENNEDLSSQIDAMMSEEISPIENITNNEKDLPDLMDIVGDYDYDKTKSNSLNTARKLLVQLLDFYLTQDFINNNQYVVHKAKLDEMGLTQIITQINHNDTMIELVMKAVHAGQINKGMFDVFSTLQRTHIELLKMQSMFILNMEETIKKIRGDYDFYKKTEHSTEPDVTTIEADSSHRGTRDLLKSLETDEDFSFDE